MPTPRRVLRYRLDQPLEEVSDVLADEEPLQIRVNGQDVSVTMRTPGHDEELALGFLISEGIIRQPADLLGVTPNAQGEAGNSVNVLLHASAGFDAGRLSRHVFLSSSCGICGKASIDQVCTSFTPVSSAGTISTKTLLTLPGRLRASQTTFDTTGGLHGVGLFKLDGSLIVAREDVGRHNAVDKVLGYAFKRGLLPASACVLMVSGRVSFEIVQKALAGGIPIIAAVSAPTSLACEFAAESNQTLVGFLRDGRFNVYSGEKRVVEG